MSDDLSELRERVAVLETRADTAARDITVAADNFHRSLRRVETRFERSVKRLEKLCGQLAGRLDTNATTKATSRATIVVGLLGASSTILAVVLPKLMG